MRVWADPLMSEGQQRTRKYLEALLTLWHHPPYWHEFDAELHEPYRHVQDELSATERGTWNELVRRCEVWPPASSLAGMQAFGELTDGQPTPELRIIGDRVACGPRPSGVGYRWSLAFRDELNEGEQRLLEKKFRARALRERLRRRAPVASLAIGPPWRAPG